MPGVHPGGFPGSVSACGRGREKVNWIFRQTGEKWMFFRILQEHAIGVCIAMLAFFCVPAGAQQEPPSLTRDSGFDEARDDALGPWELRYVRRMRVPTTRPNWKAWIRVDEKNPSRGRHLSLEQEGPASGIVYIGQIVRLPEAGAALEFSFDYRRVVRPTSAAASWMSLSWRPRSGTRWARPPKRRRNRAMRF